MLAEPYCAVSVEELSFNVKGNWEIGLTYYEKLIEEKLLNCVRGIEQSMAR